VHANRSPHAQTLTTLQLIVKKKVLHKIVKAQGKAAVNRLLSQHVATMLGVAPESARSGGEAAKMFKFVLPKVGTAVHARMSAAAKIIQLRWRARDQAPEPITGDAAGAQSAHGTPQTVHLALTLTTRTCAEEAPLDVGLPAGGAKHSLMNMLPTLPAADESARAGSEEDASFQPQEQTSLAAGSMRVSETWNLQGSYAKMRSKLLENRTSKRITAEELPGRAAAPPKPTQTGSYARMASVRRSNSTAKASSEAPAALGAALKLATQTSKLGGAARPKPSKLGGKDKAAAGEPEVSQQANCMPAELQTCCTSLLTSLQLPRR